MIPGWKEELEGEYLKYLKERGKATPGDIAARFDVSECCAIYWLTDMARDGRVRILGVEVIEDGETICGSQTPLMCQRRASCPAEDRVATLDGEG